MNERKSNIVYEMFELIGLFVVGLLWGVTTPLMKIGSRGYGDNADGAAAGESHGFEWLRPRLLRLLIERTLFFVERPKVCLYVYIARTTNCAPAKPQPQPY